MGEVYKKMLDNLWRKDNINHGTPLVNMIYGLFGFLEWLSCAFLIYLPMPIPLETYKNKIPNTRPSTTQVLSSKILENFSKKYLQFDLTCDNILNGLLRKERLQ